MLLQHHFQNAFVTRNRDAAVELLRRQYGLDDFIFFEPNMDMLTPDGPRRSISRVAMAWAGGLQVEVIEPVGGEIDVYSAFLPADQGLRHHHICMRTFDWDALLQTLADKGWPIAFEGHMDGLKFVYVDTRRELGHYLEYLWATPEMWQMLGGPA